MAGASSRRELFLQVDGTTDPLTRALKAGKSTLAEFGAEAGKQADAVQEAFQKLGGATIDQQAKAMERSFKQSLFAIRDAANDALKMPATGAGALDLGAGNAQAAAAAATARATALREVADAATRAAAATGADSAAANVYAVSARSAAVAAEEEAAALRVQAGVLASVQGELDAAGRSAVLTEEQQRRLTVSSGAMKAGMQQLSYQLNDVATMFAMGAPPMQIFASQSGQVIQAVSLMSGEATGFLGVLGGQWGLVLTSAIVVLAPLVAKLFEGATASKEMALANDGLSDAQSALGRMFDLTSGKLEHQNELLRLNAQLTAMNLSAKAAEHQASATQTLGDARVSSWGNMLLPKYIGSEIGAGPRQLIAGVQEGSIDPTKAVKMAQTVDMAGSNISRQQLIQAIVDATSAKFEQKTADAIEKTLATGKLDPSLKRDPPDRKPPKPKVDHSAEQAADKDRAYQAELDRAQNEYSKAQLALVDTAEARLEVALDDIRSSKVQRDLQIDDELKAKKINEQQAEKLKQINADTAALKELAATRQKESRLINEQFERERASIDASDALLRLQSDLATTRKERLRIEQELLEHAQQLRRDAIARTINDPNASTQDKQNAVIAAQNLPSVEAGEKKQLGDRFASPLDNYKKQLRENVGDMNDALEGVAVDGLKGLEDGLTGIIMGTKSVKQAFREMAASIIQDLIRIGIEKAIISAIGGGIFGGGGIGLGAAGGMVPGAATGLVPGFAGGSTDFGGIIRGPGSGRSDSILAVLGGKQLIRVSNGESIMTAKATRHFGPILKAMNDDRWQGFADGMVDNVHQADFSAGERRAIQGPSRRGSSAQASVRIVPSEMFEAVMEQKAEDVVARREPDIVGKSVAATQDAQQRRIINVSSNYNGW